MILERNGICTSCGKAAPALTVIDDVTLVCNACLALRYTLCDVCRTYRENDYENFELLPKGRKMCEHCVRALEADFAAAFSDELTPDAPEEAEAFGEGADDEIDFDELPEEELFDDDESNSDEDEPADDPDFDPDDDAEEVLDGDIYDD